ncbi:MAG: aminotransferase [Rhodothermales bacterium]|jgi:aminotransferase
MSDSKSPHDWIARHIAALPKSGIRDFFELVMSMDDVISMGVGEPDFNTPWRIREATIFALERGRTSYTSNLGMLSLRQAVSKYVAQEFGVQYNPENECLITVGVSEALDLALRAILDPGDEVIYHEPCYVSYAPSILMAHAVPVPVVTTVDDEFALDPKRLAAAVTPRTKAILLNFPNNPTGANLSDEQKREIAQIANEHDLVVIADDIYAELTYEDPTPSLSAYPGMRGRTIFLHGLSKAYAMTGFRIGHACGPAPLIDAMMKIHQYSMLCASLISQEAALEALTSGRPAMLEMKEEYRMRRNMVVRRLNAMGLPCVKPAGAFYVFPDITPTGLDAAEFAKRLLLEQRVAVVPGTAFGECGAGFVRCSYAASIEQLEIAMDRMAIFVENLREAQVALG